MNYLQQKILQYILFISSLTTLSAGIVRAESEYKEALRDFYNNNPSEAAQHFQDLVDSGNTDPDTYIYLAYAYEQLGSYSQAIDVLNTGLNFERNTPERFYFNLGNIFRQQGDHNSALNQYSFAINLQENYFDAYLNRANIFLTEKEYPSALVDYKHFIEFAPQTHSLIPDVQRMIDALSQEIADEESRKKAEEDRRQALLREILNNLEAAGQEDPTLNAGTEEISEEEEDYNRVD